MKQKHISKQKRLSRQKNLSLYLGILLFIILICVPSCSSLPSGIGEKHLRESGDSPAETITDEGVLPSEPPVLAEAATENDFADIQRRAEEDLAYLDTPVNPDLPEPVYFFPEDEAKLADAETVSESGEPDQAALVGDDGPLFGLEPEEPSESQTEIADATINGTITGESDASSPAETVAAEPPPPASLLPPREVSAVSPPRPQGFAMPVSLPQQPARVPASETERESGEKMPPPITRTVRAALGENIEISLPDSGWVYLGEANEQKGLSYQRRRVSVDGQIFVFRPETAGSYRLKFKKQDLLRGTDMDAVIEVAVVEKMAAVPADIAAIEKAPPKEASAPIPTSGMEVASGEGGLPSSPPATALIDEEHPAAIAAIIDDAALWNRGRELETPGANRDMKGALTAYKTLVRNYPQSEYYSGSQKRIAYIERFFVNIH